MAEKRNDWRSCFAVKMERDKFFCFFFLFIHFGVTCGDNDRDLTLNEDW